MKIDHARTASETRKKKVSTVTYYWKLETIIRWDWCFFSCVNFYIVKISFGSQSQHHKRKKTPFLGVIVKAKRISLTSHAKMKLRERRSKRNFLGSCDKLIEVGFDHFGTSKKKICIPRYTKQMWTGFAHATLKTTNFTVNCTYAIPKVALSLTCAGGQQTALLCARELHNALQQMFTLIGFNIHNVYERLPLSPDVLNGKCTFLQPCENFSLSLSHWRVKFKHVFQQKLKK